MATNAVHLQVAMGVQHIFGTALFTTSAKYATMKGNFKEGDFRNEQRHDA
jgi:hypothetical protein